MRTALFILLAVMGVAILASQVWIMRAHARAGTTTRGTDAVRTVNAVLAAVAIALALWAVTRG